MVPDVGWDEQAALREFVASIEAGQEPVYWDSSAWYAQFTLAVLARLGLLEDDLGRRVVELERLQARRASERGSSPATVSRVETVTTIVADIWAAADDRADRGAASEATVHARDLASSLLGRLAGLDSGEELTDELTQAVRAALPDFVMAGYESEASSLRRVLDGPPSR